MFMVYKKGLGYCLLFLTSGSESLGDSFGLSLLQFPYLENRDDPSLTRREFMKKCSGRWERARLVLFLLGLHHS